MVRVHRNDLEPGQSLEHCAEKCSRMFVEIAIKDKVLLEHGQVKPAEMHEQLFHQIADLCSKFRFINLITTSIDDRELRRFINSKTNF